MEDITGHSLHLNVRRLKEDPILADKDRGISAEHGQGSHNLISAKITEKRNGGREIEFYSRHTAQKIKVAVKISSQFKYLLPLFFILMENNVIIRKY